MLPPACASSSAPIDWPAHSIPSHISVDTASGTHASGAKKVGQIGLALRVVENSGAAYGNFTCMATKRTGPGRPPLGERTRVPVRMPTDVYEALRDEARTRGISMSQYMADLAAIHLGFPEAALKLTDLEEVTAA